MIKKLGLMAITMAVAMLGPISAASASSVKIPHSAREWGAFTSAEKAAAYTWVWQKYDELVAAGLINTDIPRHQSPLSPQSSTTIHYGVECDFNVSNQGWGTYTTGWASTWADTSLWSIDTGLSSPSLDTMYRNGAVFNSFGAAGGGTYIYASSAQDFKWSWESVTYQIQSWGAGETAYNSYLFINLYCGKSRSV